MEKHQETDTFHIRSYGRTELALAYSPDLSPMAAWRRLDQWIVRYPGLSAHLSSIGYRTGQRAWTPAQVKAIVEALGEP